jgi:hypothetical protein
MLDAEVINGAPGAAGQQDENKDIGKAFHLGSPPHVTGHYRKPMTKPSQSPDVLAPADAAGHGAREQSLDGRAYTVNHHRPARFAIFSPGLFFFSIAGRYSPRRVSSFFLRFRF